jgi:hypothetical protein
MTTPNTPRRPIIQPFPHRNNRTSSAGRLKSDDPEALPADYPGYYLQLTFTEFEADWQSFTDVCEDNPGCDIPSCGADDSEGSGSSETGSDDSEAGVPDEDCVCWPCDQCDGEIPSWWRELLPPGSDQWPESFILALWRHSCLTNCGRPGFGCAVGTPCNPGGTPGPGVPGNDPTNPIIPTLVIEETTYEGPVRAVRSWTENIIPGEDCPFMCGDSE